MLSSEEVDKIRAEYPQGTVHLVGTDKRYECIFRAPSRAEWKMFRANSHNAARVADANEQLARQTVVYPSKDAFEALMDRFPAIPEALAQDDRFKALTGITVEESSKL